MAKWVLPKSVTNQQLPLDLPPSDNDLLGHTTCGWSGCNKMIKQSQAVVACAAIAASTVQEHFCSNRCSDKWRDELPVRYTEHDEQPSVPLHLRG